jgi:DNA-binding response OmpR family regulator
MVNTLPYPTYKLQPHRMNMKMSHSVLIVDDEPMARMLLRLMLVRAGYEVQEAADGYEALAKLQEQTPSLIILDVMMPGIDGFKVCQNIRQQPETVNTPVIMLSAKSDINSVNKGLVSGATKYLTKPVSPESLTRYVKELLTESNSHQPEK